DWPDNESLMDHCGPEWQDFVNLLPCPSLTRSDGSLNMSHMPIASTAKFEPQPSISYVCITLDIQTKGTVRLRMDVLYTISIMQYASNLPDGTKGGAVWDVFMRQDVPKLRKFMRQSKALRTGKTKDPITEQSHYISSDLICALHDSKGIRPY
ncbi:hypothetical protein BKA62DRAFT_586298, partial [Auriculariales sp. MPI-PUGE-AT-0066]